MRHRRVTLGAAALAVMCSVTVSAGCAAKAGPASADTPRAGAVDVYLLIQEPDSGFGPIIDVITGARRSIRMSMYELASTKATAALVAARGRGVETQVLLDSAYRGRAANLRAFETLRAAGVNVRWAPEDVIFHEKAIVADAALAAIGTGNLSAPAFEATSRDDWVIDSAPAEVAAIAATFDGDFAAGNLSAAGPGAAAPRLIWSPDARRTFLDLIAGTHDSLWIASEEFKDMAIATAVAAAATRGVQCRVVLNQEAGATPAVDKVRSAGCSVHLVPATKHGLWVHQKVILADDQLVLGSQNLTTESLLHNRELSLHLANGDAPQLVATVRATFDHDYQLAQESAGR